MKAARSVLVVEDELLIAKDVRGCLLALGYQVLGPAASAEQAIAMASERCPDLALMDIRIQGEIDGIQTASILRERFGVPVVYLTAYADEATVGRAKATEPYGYLLKPIKEGEIQRTMELAFHKHDLDRRLRQSERWLATTLRCIADGVVMVDREGTVSFMNPAAERITGLSLQRAIGRPAREVVRLVGPELPSSPLDEVLASARARVLEETELEGPSNAIRIISDSTAAVKDGDELLGAVMVFRDITQQKLLREQTELAERLASLSAIFSGVAHEVRNPLAVVAENASLVEDGLAALLSALRTGSATMADLIALVEVMLDRQAGIRTAANRIAEVATELMSFPLPNPKLRGRADVARAVGWAIRTTSRDFHGRARLRTELRGVPPVAMDELKLGQVLVHLLLNAAHAIVPGRVEDNEVVVGAQVVDGAWVGIEVRDTGIGMAPEEAQRAFDPFFTTRPVGVGSGLGLSICRGLVLSAGGDIRLESHLGLGSVVRVRLPATGQGAASPADDRS